MKKNFSRIAAHAMSFLKQTAIITGAVQAIKA